MNIEALAVVVPARNESARVSACLRSVIRALPAHLPSWVVVVDDGSSDLTAAIAEAELSGGTGEVLRTAGGNVGAARRAGVDRALSHFHSLAPDQIWLACTDADSSVPRHWLENQLGWAGDMADAVLGLVRPVGLVGALESAFHERYRANIYGGSHGHVHGANMGIRASAYVEAGGFPAVPCHEDRILWERLVARGRRVVADSRSVVATSGRSQGRLRGGFATDIATLIAEAV